MRDFVQVRGHDKISEDSTAEALEMMEVDHLGLDKNDRRILETILEKFGGGPVGLSTIAAATSEELDTITDVHEPFLIRAGLIARTPKGRIVTESGWRHFGKTPPAQNTLL